VNQTPGRISYCVGIFVPKALVPAISFPFIDATNDSDNISAPWIGLL
jgi:hypothetical protein